MARDTVTDRPVAAGGGLRVHVHHVTNFMTMCHAIARLQLNFDSEVVGNNSLLTRTTRTKLHLASLPRPPLHACVAGSEPERAWSR